MNEIKKLYENAEVKKQIPKVCSSNELYCKECEAHIEDAMSYCKNANYPPFTAEKQIELIKFFSKREDFALDYYLDFWRAKTDFRFEYYNKCFEHNDFEQALAGLINNLWQDLTEEERKQIKDILE